MVTTESPYLNKDVPETWRMPKPTVEVEPCPDCRRNSGQRYWTSGGHWVMCQTCMGRGWKVVITQGLRGEGREVDG